MQLASIAFIVVACALSSALAYPNPDPQQNNPPKFNFNPPPTHRPFELSGGGGGSPKQGFDVNLNARAPVWQSQNGRHSFDATGQYGQHLGGPYGNSPAQWGAGGAYTFRF